MARSALRQRPKAFPRQLPSYRAAGHAHFLSTRNEFLGAEFPQRSPFPWSIPINFSELARPRPNHKKLTFLDRGRLALGLSLLPNPASKPLLSKFGRIPHLGNRIHEASPNAFA